MAHSSVLGEIGVDLMELSMDPDRSATYSHVAFLAARRIGKGHVASSHDVVRRQSYLRALRDVAKAKGYDRLVREITSAIQAYSRMKVPR